MLLLVFVYNFTNMMLCKIDAGDSCTSKELSWLETKKRSDFYNSCSAKNINGIAGTHCTSDSTARSRLCIGGDTALSHAITAKCLSAAEQSASRQRDGGSRPQWQLPCRRTITAHVSGCGRALGAVTIPRHFQIRVRLFNTFAPVTEIQIDFEHNR